MISGGKFPQSSPDALFWPTVLILEKNHHIGVLYGGISSEWKRFLLSKFNQERTSLYVLITTSLTSTGVDFKYCNKAIISWENKFMLKS
jgi:superfamily II DNA/RNA helicase